MPHVSRKKLNEGVSKKIYNHLVKVITGNGLKRGHAMMRDLLTPVEQVMLAKRLAAVVLLLQGVSSYKVRKMVGLSSRTTAYMLRDIENGNYREIEKLVKKKKDREQFWADLEVMVRLGMPEMGRGRWKWLDEIF